MKRIASETIERNARKPRKDVLGFATFAAFAFLIFVPLVAQQPPAATPPADPDKVDEGIPVTSALVRQKCESCHRAGPH